MKLFWSDRSPFVRKVMIAVHELDLVERVQLIPTMVKPTDVDPELFRHNPFGQIPTLITDDGSSRYDSFVICNYLDDLAGRGQLFPNEAARRAGAFRRHALGDGMILLLLRLFGTRMGMSLDPVTAPIEVLTAKCERVFEEIALSDLTPAVRPPDVGDIAVAVALAYSCFRLPDLNWQKRHPRLADWYADIAQRPSMMATAFSVTPRH
jgi:glutathione S-transferase